MPPGSGCYPRKSSMSKVSHRGKVQSDTTGKKQHFFSIKCATSRNSIRFSLQIFNYNTLSLVDKQPQKLITR